MSAPLQRPNASTPKVHTLSNGVRVVCDPIPGLQTVALSVVAGRGALLPNRPSATAITNTGGAINPPAVITTPRGRTVVQPPNASCRGCG